MADKTHDVDKIWDDWKAAVSMTASEIESWLNTDESKEVGQKTMGAGNPSGIRPDAGSW